MQTGFTFLVLAHLGSPGKRAIKPVCVCVCVSLFLACELSVARTNSSEYNFAVL